MRERKAGITVRIPVDLLNLVDAYGESRFGRRFDRSRFIVNAVTNQLEDMKEGDRHE